MIGRRFFKNDRGRNDEGFRFFLKRYDPATPPSAAELAALEGRIMAHINALPDLPASVEVALPAWQLDAKWALRGTLIGALFVMLGFFVGRDFDDLSFQPADSTSLFASAGGTPWQSFIAAPSTPGETDDNAE